MHSRSAEWPTNHSQRNQKARQIGLRSDIRVFSLIGSMHYKNVDVDNFVQLRGKFQKLEVKGPGSKLRR